jgi:hypothetical protein
MVVTCCSADGSGIYPESPRFWPSGKAGSAGRSSAATARHRADAGALGAAVIAGRARGGGAAGRRQCGGCSAREANAEAAISESVKQRRLVGRRRRAG